MIRWITETLGTAPASEWQPQGGVALVDVRDLVDKAGNSADAVRRKIDEAVAHLQAGRRVVVGCDYGISRSNAIAAGILAAAQSLPFTDAVRTVMAATGESDIKVEPLNVVLRALAGTVAGAAAAAPGRVLVTGAHGFVGRASVPRLEAGGFTVFAPARAEIDLGGGAALLDVFVKERGISQIVHLANPRVYTSNRAVGETLTMLRNVIDVCVGNGLHLTYPSGWEIYSGYRGAELVADESLPPLPKGPYGEAKWLAETMIAHHRARGLTCAVLRSSPLYGPGSPRPRFIYTFIEKAARCEPIYTHRYRNGAPKLDLMHVDDFTVALAETARVRPYGAFNLGTGRLLGTDQVAALVRDRLGSTSRIESRDVDDDVAGIAIDARHARRTLGWEPRVTFEDGLARIIETVGTRGEAR